MTNFPFQKIALFLLGLFAAGQAQDEEMDLQQRDGQNVFLNQTVKREWVRRYNGPGNQHDTATAIAVDDSGNVYVTGTSSDSSWRLDYATVKYNRAGVKEWSRLYNGPDKGNDRAYALAVDDSGNVYVTGSSPDSISGASFATIKYNGAGVKQWVARYKGGTPTAIVIDPLGNIIVAGSIYTTFSSNDFILIKYNKQGLKQWVRRYNGSGNNDDVIGGLAVDDAGNVYVTGSSVNSNLNFEYVTIKYNAVGLVKWTRRYADHPSTSYQARSVAIDDSGNVLITGSGYRKAGVYYVTVKYDATGNRRWARRYDGPLGIPINEAKAIAVDHFGGVYVTGFGMDSSGYGFATVKYNTGGNEQWVARYHGPTIWGSQARAMALDENGNVYITGISSSDYLTVKYNGAGAVQWAATYNGPGNLMDHATAIAVDNFGHVYVTGASSNSNRWTDYATIKYFSSPAPTAFPQTIAAENKKTFDAEVAAPIRFQLKQNFPNPFNPSTTIRFELPVAGRVKLTVYNLRGELVRTLADGEMPVGSHRVVFAANDLAAGIYFYRMEAGSFVMTRKMILQK